MRACVLLVLFCATVAAQDKVGVEPLAPDPALDARVEELIGTLQGIDKPGHGIGEASGGGVAFDAIDTDPPTMFRELVRLGPAAIPALLKHLDDKRETKLSFHWRESDGMGGIFEQPELFAGSPAERALIVRTLGAAGVKNPPWDEPPRGLDCEKVIRDHAVTVGDCCFAILGQVVHRSYEAVRYQPSGITIISSPTRDPRISAALREWWGRGDPREVLAKSLLDDLLDKEFDGDPAGAALRLLVYFPDEGAAAVAKRIAEWPWGGQDDKGAELLKVAMATGHALVRAEWLKLLDRHRRVEGQLAALAATPADPGDDARERIRAIRLEVCALDGDPRESVDLDLVLACVAALPDERSRKAFAWLEKRFAAIESRDAGQAQVILAALASIDERESLPIYLRHIERMKDYGWTNVLYALGEAPRPWLATALFCPRLDMTDLALSAVRKSRWVTARTRWCDLAAAVLAEAMPDLAFDANGTVEHRDRQIAAIRAALAK